MMWYFAIFVTICRLSDATVLETFTQGQAFTQCISNVDFTTKTLLDDITLVDRAVGGACCPSGTSPGIKRYARYWGSQVVCGFTADGGISWSVGSSTCTYGACYLVKQHLPCAGNTRQKLNGCCGVRGAMTWPANCLHTLKSMKTVPSGATVDYCLNYHKKYGTVGDWGTSTGADDQVDGILDATKFYAYAACAGSMVAAGYTTGGTTGDTTSDTTASVLDTTGGVVKKLSSYKQGAKFNECIAISEFHSAQMDTDVTFYPRATSGCCRKFTTAGAPRTITYYGAQIVCGTSDGGAIVGRTKSTCTYSNCYVMKQNIPCNDNSRQRLNGCCNKGTYAAGSWTWNTDCLYKTNTFKNAQLQDVRHCWTYHKDYSTLGKAGTVTDADDQKEGSMVVTNVHAYTACAGSVIALADSVGFAHQLSSMFAMGIALVVAMH